MNAQSLIDTVSIQILADKDWNNFRWMELRNKVEEDEKAEQTALEDLAEEEDIRNYEKEQEVKNANND